MAGKCKTFKDLDNGMTNKDVVAKYGVPQSNVSTWVKSKMTASLKTKRINSSKKMPRCGNYEKVDKTIDNWFIDKRTHEIPIDGVIIKGKALEFAKGLGVTEFKPSNCWLINWKKR